MGTLRDEMTKVLSEWDKQDEQVTQPTQPTQEINMTKRGTTTQILLNLVEKNPGITSIAARKLIKDSGIDIPDDHVSSMLKQMTDRFHLTREDTGELVQGRALYKYTAIPASETKALRASAKLKLKAAQARAEKARAAKAAKKLEREQLGVQLGISDLVPQPPSVATTSIYNTKPLSSLVWSAQEALNGLSVLQARELYDELKKIFGG